MSDMVSSIVKNSDERPSGPAGKALQQAGVHVKRPPVVHRKLPHRSAQVRFEMGQSRNASRRCALATSSRVASNVKDMQCTRTLGNEELEAFNASSALRRYQCNDTAVLWQEPVGAEAAAADESTPRRAT